MAKPHIAMSIDMTATDDWSCTFSILVGPCK